MAVILLSCIEVSYCTCGFFRSWSHRTIVFFSRGLQSRTHFRLLCGKHPAMPGGNDTDFVWNDCAKSGGTITHQPSLCDRQNGRSPIVLRGQFPRLNYWHFLLHRNVNPDLLCSFLSEIFGSSNSANEVPCISSSASASDEWSMQYQQAPIPECMFLPVSPGGTCIWSWISSS